MILKKARVKEFLSVWDSNEFELSDITCLVGKNEAGKTAILQALYRLNPYIPSEGGFDVTDDYPRSKVTDYEYDIEKEKRSKATVVRADFELEPHEIRPIEKVFGSEALESNVFTESKGYGVASYSLSTNEKAALEHISRSADLSSKLTEALKEAKTFKDAQTILTDEEKTDEINKLLSRIIEVTQIGSFKCYIYKTYVEPKMPKFLYFDEYYQMKGIENIEALQKRVNSQNLEKSDYPLLGLLERARLDLDDLRNPERTQKLKNQLEGASNYINAQVLEYWSQNKHIRLEFDVRPAIQGDPEGMRQGTNVWAEINDTRHQVRAEIGKRSKGFVWFFSFLAWYSQIKDENLILLLDEPGLSLHGRGQADLLRYFDAEVTDHHQLVYSTHLPFMVDPSNFDRVRIVQDRGIDSEKPLPIEEDGTKVHDNVLKATDDSLFPLHGAMGFDLYQTLFIGPNNLIVEGKSDLIFLQIMSSLLIAKGREPLSPLWTVIPTGGDGRIYLMAPLLAAQKKLRVAILMDKQNKDKDQIESLHKDKLFKKSHIVTYADVLRQEEADIEDLFDTAFYVDLINKEYTRELFKDIELDDLNEKIPRIHVQLSQYFKENPMDDGGMFSHYRPARYMAQNLDSIKVPSKRTLDRFEKLFKQLNTLLSS